MKVRSVTLAFVSSVYLAALGATSSSVFASSPATNPLTTQAYTALAGGDNDRAISLYTQAIEARDLAPELLANSLLNRALALQQQNKQAAAIDDYTSALSLDAMSADLRATALYNRGLSQQKLNKATLAIEDFTSSLLLNPTFAHAFYSRGNALRDSGQYLFALSDFERALKYNHPDPARVYFSQAQTFELLQRPIDARRALEAALGANPNFALARDKLAAMGDAPEGSVDVAYTTATDPILTGSISAVGGNTLVHKPDLPKGVEPPAELMLSNSTDSGAEQIQASAKTITDRIPETETETDAIAQTLPAKTADKIIVVASVPEIPPTLKKAPKIVKPVAELVDDVETASIDPAPAATQIIGWNVQVASAASEDAAWSTWTKMQKAHKILVGQKASVVRADLGAKGIFYRVKLTGFDNQKSATSRCSKLKSSGVACFVSKAG